MIWLVFLGVIFGVIFHESVLKILNGKLVTKMSGKNVYV